MQEKPQPHRQAMLQQTEANLVGETTESNKGFSVAAFWEKLKKYAGTAGKEVVEVALKLFYAWQDPDTPQSAKAIILSALVYFIVPTDAVVDFLPGGYVDDWGALLGAMWTVAAHIKESHVEQAKTKLQEWFPQEQG